MRCNGLHCEGCGHGGGAAGAVIALLVIIALALRKAWPAIVSAVEIAAWTVAGVTGAAIVITAGVLTTRAVRRRRARRALVYRHGQPFVVVVDEAQTWFAHQVPAAGAARVRRDRATFHAVAPLAGHRLAARRRGTASADRG